MSNTYLNAGDRDITEEVLYQADANGDPVPFVSELQSLCKTLRGRLIEREDGSHVIHAPAESGMLEVNLEFNIGDDDGN